MSKTASDFFAEIPRRYNCAQSVAAGAGREDLISAMAAMGGGRAPEGMCGALYAALQLLPEEKQAAAMAEFQNKAGSMLCREIKSGTVFSCAECVALAEQLLKK